MSEPIKLGPNVIAAIQRACGQSEAVQVACAAYLEALGKTGENDKYNLVIEARLEPAETAQIPLKAVED